LIALTKIGPGPGAVGLTEREPRPLEPGHVRLQVHATGVCGTDLHVVSDEYSTEPPVTMGHEISGTVLEIGEGVDASWVGQRVACETYYSTCERCPQCRDGRRNLCRERRSLGSFEDGGFARTVVVPGQNLHRIPDTVTSLDAVLLEPLACVAQCLLDPARVSPGDSVLVVGPGTMGLLSAQVALAAGATVTCAGLASDVVRLGRAEKLGAAVTTDPVVEGFDVVVECSGAAGGIATAFRSVRRGGTYVQVGIHGERVAVDFDTVLYKELAVSSGFASTPASWRRAIALVGSGAVDLTGMVTHALPLEQWEEAFAIVGSPEAVKVALQP